MRGNIESMQTEADHTLSLLDSIETVAEIFDLLGVAILVVGIGIATLLFISSLVIPAQAVPAIKKFKIRIGRAMLLGLEVLIAADIVKTVALEPTIDNVAALGLLVIVRTFLSWTLALEIEGHWPWQANKKKAVANANQHEQ